ncbi:MAG: hypothetical protein H7235_08305 [Bdellovibrionaceae bacterium]|nr:hypothetical protein [Pseudobdellovibrionaceae bacterium]
MKNCKVQVTENPPNISNKNWFPIEMNKRTPFFYLIKWDLPGTMIKFGYKLSTTAFATSYGKLHHLKPTEVYVWPIKLIASPVDKYCGVTSTLRTIHFRDFVFHAEQQIHKKLNSDDRINRISKSREYYQTMSVTYSLEIIRNNLININDDFFEFIKLKHGKNKYF